jgi:hypothetical protein
LILNVAISTTFLRERIMVLPQVIEDVN